MRFSPGPRGRRGDAVVPAWTIATVLSMVVATVGVQEIASRVADPLQLGARGDGGEPALTLSQRPGTGRFDQAREQPLGSFASERPVPVRTGSGGPPSMGELSPPVVAPPPAVPVDGDWEVAVGGEGLTRWSRVGDGDEQPRYETEFLNLDREWERGYGDNADATLTTPWFAVPRGDGELHLVIDSVFSTEAVYDWVDVSISVDGTSWERLERFSGSSTGAAAWRLQALPLGIDPDRVRVQFHLHSDVARSSRSRGVPFLDVDGRAGVRRVSLVRGDFAVDPAWLGRPRTRGVVGFEPDAVAVIARPSQGINPYHEQFRDDSARAWVHPSRYLPGYPEDAVPLWLTLDAPSYEAAFETDLELWGRVRPDTTYWIPGTRIVAARAFGGCEGRCLIEFEPDRAEFAEQLHGRPTGIGTSFASRAVAADFGGCPDCLFVAGENSDDAGWVDWMTAQSWIDVQVIDSNERATVAVDTRGGIGRAVQQAVDRQVVVSAAVGLSDVTRGAAFQYTGTTSPTLLHEQTLTQDVAGIPGVVVVGGHDGGHVLPSTGPPPHLVDQVCSGWKAMADHVDEVIDGGLSTGSAASHAAGRIGAMLLEARRVLGVVSRPLDAEGNVLARGLPVSGGPLADGELTIEELKQLVFHTATPRPPRSPEGPRCDDFGPSSTQAVAYEDLPDGVPAWWFAGYGLLDDPAVDLAERVLRGEATALQRSVEDAHFALDREVRHRMTDAWFLARCDLGEALFPCD